MSGFDLSSPRAAEDPIGRLFLDGTPARISVSEDVAFKGGWLDLGTISLRAAEQTRPEVVSAVRRGAFRWDVPGTAQITDQLRTLFGFAAYTAKALKTAEQRLPGLLNRMASVAVRTGLARPRFDARSLSEMPFRRPTTIVADTSGVIQGAMSFVADHLHPMARMKIPAVLHMEVINQADRFMKTRRSEGVRGEVLLGEHLLSQTGQRTLLRLELRDDAEVERNLLLSDPLRNAFKEDRDPDLRELNLTVPLRSYVDRMILESARQHQSFASPGHPVRLLTADQGLAKMALAEGITPIFFRATTADQLFGRALTGALLHPFTGRLTGSPLPHLLWELATAFGRVRLDRPNRPERIEVAAIGTDLSWSSYHSQDDLLWIRSEALATWPPDRPPARVEPDGDLLSAMAAEPADGPKAPVIASKAEPERKPASARTARAKRAAAPRKGRLSSTNQAGEAFYRLSAGGLVKLVDRLAEVGTLSIGDVGPLIGVSHESGIQEYRRFLASGEFLEPTATDWVATDRLVALAAAQRELDCARMSELLAHAPSYRAFLELLRAPRAEGAQLDLPMPSRVQPTYIALGEITAQCASVPGEGDFPTPARPSPAEFVPMALKRFEQLAPVDGLVSVGEWLEALVKDDGVHPIHAREALQEADAAGLLRRSTEGSTTDTRHDDHTLRVLRMSQGRPLVETVHLYRGDFLIPGQASSSLRLRAAVA